MMPHNQCGESQPEERPVAKTPRQELLTKATLPSSSTFIDCMIPNEAKLRYYSVYEAPRNASLRSGSGKMKERTFGALIPVKVR